MSSRTHDSPTRGPARRLIGRGFVPTDETILFDRHPSLWLVLLNAGPAIVLVITSGAVLDFLASLAQNSMYFDSFFARPLWARLGWVTLLIVALVLAWAMLDWVCRRYVLTDRRAIVIFGILHQRLAELPLDRVQNVSVSKPLLPRVLGLGHVGLASAGTDGYEIVWRAFARPDARAREVRKAVDAGKVSS